MCVRVPFACKGNQALNNKVRLEMLFFSGTKKMDSKDKRRHKKRTWWERKKLEDFKKIRAAYREFGNKGLHGGASW